MQQQREEKSSGCKFCNLRKMKIPAASCNLSLLFLFFIFCHLDLCSSLRLIGLGNSLTLSSFQKICLFSYFEVLLFFFATSSFLWLPTCFLLFLYLVCFISCIPSPFSLGLWECYCNLESGMAGFLNLVLLGFISWYIFEVVTFFFSLLCLWIQRSK